jgi:hypothetical protein
MGSTAQQDYQEYGSGSTVGAGGSQTGLNQNANLPPTNVSQNQAPGWANASQNSGQMNLGQPIGAQSATAQNQIMN